jgi:hypothetical protein
MLYKDRNAPPQARFRCRHPRCAARLKVPVENPRDAFSDRHDRRSRAAKKAAATNAERRALKVRIIAERIAARQATGPARFCFVCRKKLTDQQSVNRGIGSECWQTVLAQVEQVLRASSDGDLR